MISDLIENFPDHAVPLVVLVCGPVHLVFDEVELVFEVDHLRHLVQQVDAETLEAVVTVQRLLRLLQHHVRLFLQADDTS